jgi:hypothetical protein
VYSRKIFYCCIHGTLAALLIPSLASFTGCAPTNPAILAVDNAPPADAQPEKAFVIVYAHRGDLSPVFGTLDIREDAMFKTESASQIPFVRRLFLAGSQPARGRKGSCTRSIRGTTA